jgi:hypothetical protein
MSMVAWTAHYHIPTYYKPSWPNIVMRSNAEVWLTPHLRYAFAIDSLSSITIFAQSASQREWAERG